MNEITGKTVAVIVAHPDDETLWAGGAILTHPSWRCFIISLCRASDPDRAPKFSNVLRLLGAEGRIGDLDDGPDQYPLPGREVQESILALMPSRHFDMMITHSPRGEYTRHIRHEETGEAVIALWCDGQITMKELRLFAYEDGGRKYLPKPVEAADIYTALPHEVWLKKYKIMTEIYGFDKGSWEAETLPETEAFWQFGTAAEARAWMDKMEASL